MPRAQGAADVGHLAVEPEAETAAPQAVVPHEHDADVRDRLDERLDAARAADVFQVLALQAAGRVEQDVLAGLQAAGDVLQRRARAIAAPARRCAPGWAGSATRRAGRCTPNTVRLTWCSSASGRNWNAG